MKSLFENWPPTANQLEHQICEDPKVLEQFLVNLLSAKKTQSKQVKLYMFFISNQVAKGLTLKIV